MEEEKANGSFRKFACAESSAVRDEEQRKMRRRRQMGGTILTSPLGTTGSVSSTGNSLLGGMG